MSIIVSFIMLFMIFGIGIAIPAAIGIYVYRDAKRRGMNAALWTLIALLAPSLVGFIIYLIVRGNYSDMECPNCQTPVKEEYVRCPKCGAKLRPSCPNCAAPIEPDWKVCPRCANELPETSSDVVIPVKRKDKSLSKILLVVILVPIVLLILMFVIFGMRMYTKVGSGGTSIAYIEAEQYLQDVNTVEITAWYENCKDDHRVHVLKHESLTATGDEGKVRYLVYMPGLEDPVSIQFDNNAGFFQSKLRVDYRTYSFDKYDGKPMLILITCIGDDADLELEIYCDEEKMDYVMVDSDSPIGLTDNAEKIAEEAYSNGGKNGAVYVKPTEDEEEIVE